MEFWNSIPYLSKLCTTLQGAVVIFTCITAVLGVSLFITNNRKNSLERRQEEEFKRKVTLIDERTVKVNELKRRIINDSYRKQILDCICPYQNTKILVIANNSKESQEFSRQFEGIFKAAGWKVDHLLIGGLRRVHKMRVLKNSMYQESKSFEALSRAFRKCNLDFEHGETEGDSDDEIIFDAGVLEANDYQVAIDKID